MEQNTYLGSAVANQYCGSCGREPLCGSCAHGMWWQFGFPIRDFRWERLTAAAASSASSSTEPRTAATGEIRIAVQCCRCRHQLDQEHETPEHPLPITEGRPEGWVRCPHCRVSYNTLDNGARIQHYSCNARNRDGRQRMQQGADTLPPTWCCSTRTMCHRITVAHGTSRQCVPKGMQVLPKGGE